MNGPAIVSFDAPDLAHRVEALNLDEVDALPFGAIRLDPAGRVAFYSAREAELSGHGARVPPGVGFFTEVAPCMNTPAFWGRIRDAMARGDFELELLHIGDFASRRRRLRARAFPASAGGLWLFLLRDG